MTTLKHLLLLTFSIVLFIVILPFGIVFSFFDTRTDKLLRIAIGVDQLANASFPHLADVLLINKTGETYPYHFGNEDETLSSVLGKNLKLGTLSKIGVLVCTILSAIDSKHCLEAIEEDEKELEEVKKNS